jgi:hypothetical protein
MRLAKYEIEREAVDVAEAAPETTPTAICLHCETRPPASPLGLCEKCDARPWIRNMYYRRPGWTAADEDILRELRRRANQRLPLFPPRKG